MSASGQSKKQPVFQLRELHLVPHYIYMINEHDFELTSRYVLEIWKDQTKMGQTYDIKNIEANNLQKYPALEFGKLSFIFDVQALFEHQSSAKIKLRLAEKRQAVTLLKEEFQIHILYYNYRHSSHHLVKRKENNIGKVNQLIFNYSFTAIYGQAPQKTLFNNYGFQGRQSDIIPKIQLLAKKASKYGIIVKEPILAGHYDTIALVQAVTNHAKKILAAPAFDEGSEKLSIAPSSSQQIRRQASRAVFQTNSLTQNQEQSNITQIETAEKIKNETSYIGGWILIFISTFLIYVLMHPTRKY